MTRPRHVAAAQTLPVAGDVDANVARHLRLARAAAEQGSRLLVFPELSLTGYELPLAEALAFSREDPRLAPLREAATARSMTLVVGAPVRIGRRLYLGAFLLLPDGTLGLYTKQHLGAFSEAARVDGVVPPPEASFFHPGSQSPLLHTGDQRAAVAICADVGRPAHAARAAARGATTYLASMFVIRSSRAAEHAALRDRATRHSMAVVFANYGGPSGGLATGGSSAIWSEKGELLAALGPSGAGIVVASESDTGWNARALPIPD